MGEYGMGQYKLVLFVGSCLAIGSLDGIGMFFRGQSFCLPCFSKDAASRASTCRNAQQALSTSQYHIDRDIEQGMVERDEDIHERWLHSFWKALEGSPGLERSCSCEK